MQVDSILCPEVIEEKLATKHRVTCNEARQVLFSPHRVRFAEKGHTEGEDVYAAFGKTFAGRYLSVFFVYKPQDKLAVVISARDMSERERKAYGRK